MGGVTSGIPSRLVQSGPKPEDQLGRPRDFGRVSGYLTPGRAIVDYADCAVVRPPTIR
jgi:hypothetical protein